MFQFWLLLCNSACRCSQISLNSTSQVGGKQQQPPNTKPTSPSFISFCMRRSKSVCSSSSASIPAQTGSSSAFECERKQTTSLAEHFALFCISASAPTREISFSRALTLRTPPPLSLSLCFTKLPVVCVRERECCFNKQSRCGGDYLTPAV